MLGFALDAQEIGMHLRPLGFEVENGADSQMLKVTVPPWRTDVTIPADLIEELARMVGYDRIEPSLPTIVASSVSSAQYDTEKRIATALVGLGYREIVTLALQPAEVHERLAQFGLAVPQPVEILNPLSEDQRFMRFSLLPGFLELAARQRTALPLRVFEIGHVFRKDGEGEAELSLAAWASFAKPGEAPGWRDDGFLAAKSDALAVVRSLTGRDATVRAAQSAGLHPGKTAELLVDDALVCTLGALDPRALAAYDLDIAAYAAVLHVDALPAYRTPRYRALSRFPAIERDVAVVLAPAVPAADVEACVREAGDGIVRGVRVFDEYRGPQVGLDKKSLAVRVVLQRDDRTLTDAEADAAIGVVLASLEKRFGAILRR